jgi:spermidine synthase
MDKKSPQKGSYLLLVAVLMIATCGIVYELVAGAVASYIMGDSVRQYSLVIGIYLFSMGVGSYFAKFVEDDLLDKFIDIEIIVSLIGGFSAMVLFLAFGQNMPVQWLLYFILFLIGLLIGMEIPLIMRVLEGQLSFRSLVSHIFTFDYIGALLASILFPLFLVPQLGLIRTSLLFGMVNVSVAYLVISAFRSQIRRPNTLTLKASLALAALALAFFFAERIQRYAENELLGEVIIFSKSTDYQRIVLTRDRRHLKLYLNNNLQFSTFDEYRYHETLVHPAMSLSDSVRNVLILGGGDGLAAREVLKYPQVEHVTLIDLDRDMTNLFRGHGLLTQLNANSLNDPRLQVVNEDAFVWLKKHSKQETDKYQVAILDFPDPSNYAVGKLYTTYFYKILKAALTDNAVIECQATSPLYGRQSFWCIEQTIQSVFPFTTPLHVHVPSFGEWGFVLASAQPIQIQTIKRQVNQLRFYDFELASLTYFHADIAAKTMEINRLDNQILVRYFEQDWR